MNRLQQYLQALAARCQATEEGLSQLLLNRRIGSAIGAQLDVLGKIVGQARGSLSDADFRRYIRARVVANASSGTVEDVLRVIDGVLNDPSADLELTTTPPAAFRIRVASAEVNDAVADILLDFLRDTAAAGVNAILQYTPAAPADALLCDLTTDPGVGQGVCGLSSAPTVGGKLSRAVR